MPEPTQPEKRPRRRANKGVTVKSSPEAIERRKRDLQCVELRGAGVKWQVIADQLKYASPGHAYDSFMAIMREYPREDVETVRNLIFDRYETIIRAVWPKVLKGDNWSIDRASRVLEAEAKLMGANRPEKVEISVGATELDAALRELETEMKARAGGAPVPVE
jgi:hypothetical protein